MTWHASLRVDYSLRTSPEGEKTAAFFQHNGPLRVLQSLYPEGPAVCHNVVVHPPGGLVSGDILDMRFSAGEGAHGLVTTPGATRFYRSDGKPAMQRTSISLDADSRLEWLPFESIAFNGCEAENRLTLALAAGAEMMGWDVTALGLPAARQPFTSGHFCQHLELPGVWLERAKISATDKILLDSTAGMAGHRCFATLFFAAGSALDKIRRQMLLDVARSVVSSHPLCVLGGVMEMAAGVTSPNKQVVVVRVLAPVVEPAMTLLRAVWLCWRQELWNMKASAPRVWST